MTLPNANRRTNLPSLTLATALALFSAWSIRMAGTLSAGAPALVATPSAVSMGAVKQGDEKSVDVVLSNPSASDTLEIDDILSGCGCTLISIDHRELKPQQSSTVTFTWNFGNRRYRTQIDALVKYHVEGSEQRPGILRIPLSAYVEPQMVIIPIQLTFNESENEPLNELIHVRRGDGWKTGHLEKVAVSHDSVEARIIADDPASGTAIVEVSVMPLREMDRRGLLIKRSVELLFNDAVERRLSIPIE